MSDARDERMETMMAAYAFAPPEARFEDIRAVADAMLPPKARRFTRAEMRDLKRALDNPDVFAQQVTALDHHQRQGVKRIIGPGGCHAKYDTRATLCEIVTSFVLWATTPHSSLRVSMIVPDMSVAHWLAWDIVRRHVGLPPYLLPGIIDTWIADDSLGVVFGSEAGFRIHEAASPPRGYGLSYLIVIDDELMLAEHADAIASTMELHKSLRTSVTLLSRTIAEPTPLRTALARRGVELSEVDLTRRD